MIEVLWHGRGGQGAFTAARLLGAAASLAAGSFALAFPSFGPERRGAPMRAFTKVDASPIGNRSAIAHADYVVYLDDTLLGSAWEDELKPGGVVLVNSARSFDDERIVAIDANGLSERILGRAIPNTALLGALCALCDAVSVEQVKQAVRECMPAKLHEANERVVENAFALVGESGAAIGISSCDQLKSADASRETSASEELAAADDRGRVSSASLVRPFAAARTPALRDAHASVPSLDPAVFARSTCYSAGHLVAKNAGWRNVRPVVDEQACTGCLQCYLYCPDGTVFTVVDDSGDAAAGGVSKGRPRKKVAIDYDFCKGCGICAKTCKFGAIEMVDEAQALAEATRRASRDGEVVA